MGAFLASSCGGDKVDLHYLKIFHTIAKENIVTKAAEALHNSQPAISVQIRKLEEELGIRLFDRVGKRMALNEGGRLLFEATAKAFAALEEAEHALLKTKETIGGPVFVGGSATPGTYLLPKIIGQFKKTYPLTSTKLHISSRLTGASRNTGTTYIPIS
jgi:DNA-binding transcriptional LysR family regulator